MNYHLTWLNDKNILIIHLAPLQPLLGRARHTPLKLVWPQWMRFLLVISEWEKCWFSSNHTLKKIQAKLFFFLNFVYYCMCNIRSSNCYVTSLTHHQHILKAERNVYLDSALCSVVG
jgi:hypothetical protein